MSKGEQMSDRLVIKNRLVKEAGQGAKDAQGYLESAESFAGKLAAAVGPAGPLAKEVEKQESEWEIRRRKMSESLGKLARLVEACDKEFERLDRKIAEELQQKPEEKKPEEKKPGEKRPDAGSSDSGNGGGISGGGSPAPARPDTEAPHETTKPAPAGTNPGSAPLEGAGSGSGASGDAGGAPGLVSPGAAGAIGGDPERNRQLGQLINDFAQRWAELTGQPVGKVLSVMGGLLGLGALVSLGVVGAESAKGTGPALGRREDSATGAGNVSEVQPREDFSEPGVDSPAQDQDPGGSGTPAMDDPVKGGETTPTPGTDPGVSPEIPDLEVDQSLGDLEALTGSSDSVGSEAADLPPLTGSSDTGGGTPSPEPLPDLGVSDPGISGGTTGTPSELPSLTPSEPTAAPTAASGELPSLDGGSGTRSFSMMGAPLMMGGMAGLAAAGGSGNSSSSSSEVSVAAQEAAGFDRRTERQEAADVLLDDDQFRGEDSNGSGL